MPVPKLVLRELREQRKRQAKIRLKKGNKWQDHGLIFTTSTGNVLPPNWYHMGPKSSISTAAEIRPVSLHTLRKTGASLLESLGVSRAETQVALRHKRPSVTDIYVSVYMEQRREHMEELADLLIDGPIPHSTLKVG